MKYSVDEKLDKYKSTWLTEEIHKEVSKDKERFDLENKENKKTISVQKIVNNILAKYYDLN